MRIVYLPICVCKYLTNITSIRYLPIIPIILKGISYHDELAQKVPIATTWAHRRFGTRPGAPVSSIRAVFGTRS